MCKKLGWDAFIMLPLYLYCLVICSIQGSEWKSFMFIRLPQFIGLSDDASLEFPEELSKQSPPPHFPTQNSSKGKTAHELKSPPDSPVLLWEEEGRGSAKKEREKKWALRASAQKAGKRKKTELTLLEKWCKEENGATTYYTALFLLFLPTGELCLV